MSRVLDIPKYRANKDKDIVNLVYFIRFIHYKLVSYDKRLIIILWSKLGLFYLYLYIYIYNAERSTGWALPLTHCTRSLLAVWALWHGLMSDNREASKMTVNSSHFHPTHQHYTDEAHKAETVPSVEILHLDNFVQYRPRELRLNLNKHFGKCRELAKNGLLN
jgi:hypothetical protein